MAPKATKPAIKKAKTNINLAKEEPLRGKAARNDFLTDVATSAGLTLNDCKKFVDGLRTTVARNLRGNNKCRIPTMVTFNLKVLKAREAGPQMIFGKEKMVKARLKDVRTIKISPLKDLRDQVL